METRAFWKGADVARDDYAPLVSLERSRRPVMRWAARTFFKRKGPERVAPGLKSCGAAKSRRSV
jgi:hypothetical protein